MDTMTQLHVRRDEIAVARTAQVEAAQPGDGDVVLAVERFALTANNVTYAVMGDALQYWRFFPTDAEGQGIVPAWGTATVVASEHAEVSVGERWYGFVPMASHLTVRPGRVGAVEVVDASPHREDLAGVYQRYQRLDADPLHDPATLDLELLYRPLFTTAFLLAEALVGDAGGEPHEVVVVTSASSKTGSALAHLLRGRDVAVVGVTSQSNVEHVTASGLYDRVLAYGELEGLADLDGRAAVVDLAGRADVVAGAVEVLPDPATHLVVGVTHHDADAQPPASAGGPEPTMFFAPTHAATLAREWGPSVLAERIAAAWRPFVEEVAADLEVVEVDGLAAAADAWPGLVAGDIDPGTGLVVAVT